MTLPLTILGGYLGAGKTTLVNHLLRNAQGRRLAIMVNEFGALPIDSDLIEADGDDLITLAGGCVCCSYGDDLMMALAKMVAFDPAPDHILLEASGVALPGAIASSVGLISGLSLQGIVVLVDADQLGRQLRNKYLRDTIERQLISADLVILNKTDLVDETGRREARTSIAKHATEARLFETTEADVPPSLVLCEYPFPQTDEIRHHTSHLLVRTLDTKEPVDPEAFAKELASDKTLLRAKGHVVDAADGSRWTLQMVGPRFRLSPARSDSRLSVIVISLKQDGNG